MEENDDLFTIMEENDDWFTIVVAYLTIVIGIPFLCYVTYIGVEWMLKTFDRITWTILSFLWFSYWGIQMKRFVNRRKKENKTIYKEDYNVGE